MENLKQSLNQIFIVKPWIIFLSLMLVFALVETLLGQVLFLIFTILFTYWTLGIGERLHAKLDKKSPLNIKRFKFQIWYVVSYMLIILITMGGYEINQDNMQHFGWEFWLIIPGHLIMMYCMIHTIYFISRCITTLRNRKESYGIYMLGFWFFPIGIWIIQPRIIELLNEEPF